MARKRTAQNSPAPIVEPVLLSPTEGEADESLLDAAADSGEDEIATEPATNLEADTVESSDEPMDTPLDPRRAELAELEAKRGALLELLSGVQRERYALQQQETELSREIDRLTGRIEPLQKQESEADAIQAYIKRQNEVRLEKAARVQSLLQVGVDPSELRKPVSQLDAALARNRKRGGQRPEYPKVG